MIYFKIVFIVCLMILILNVNTSPLRKRDVSEEEEQSLTLWKSRERRSIKDDQPKEKNDHGEDLKSRERRSVKSKKKGRKKWSRKNREERWSN